MSAWLSRMWIWSCSLSSSATASCCLWSAGLVQVHILSTNNIVLLILQANKFWTCFWLKITTNKGTTLRLHCNLHLPTGPPGVHFHLSKSKIYLLWEIRPGSFLPWDGRAIQVQKSFMRGVWGPTRIVDHGQYNDRTTIMIITLH